MKEGTGFAKSNPEDNSFFRCASSLQVALPLTHSCTHSLINTTHRMPCNLVYCTGWIPSKSSRICELHFKQSDLLHYRLPRTAEPLLPGENRSSHHVGPGKTTYAHTGYCIILTQSDVFFLQDIKCNILLNKHKDGWTKNTYIPYRSTDNMFSCCRSFLCAAFL